MPEQLRAALSHEPVKVVLVLFLSFLVGLEREERRARVGRYAFGGIRTFPLIGFLGYGVARLATGNVIALAIGLAVVGAMMFASYRHKLAGTKAGGATTELSGL